MLVMHGCERLLVLHLYGCTDLVGGTLGAFFLYFCLLHDLGERLASWHRLSMDAKPALYAVPMVAEGDKDTMLPAAAAASC